jgi:hypothetical protein
VGRFGCAVLNAIRVVELNTNELGVIYNLYPYFDLAESAESAPLKKRSRIFFPLFFSLCAAREESAHSDRFRHNKLPQLIVLTISSPQFIRGHR